VSATQDFVVLTYIANFFGLEAFLGSSCRLRCMQAIAVNALSGALPGGGSAVLWLEWPHILHLSSVLQVLGLCRPQLSLH
jgi:hypothetical protein